MASETKPTPGEIERAADAANTALHSQLLEREAVDFAIAFLRALEMEGLKLMDGEVTAAMIGAAKDGVGFLTHQGWRHGYEFMFAAAPTLADRLTEEK